MLKGDVGSEDGSFVAEKRGARLSLGRGSSAPHEETDRHASGL